MVAQLENELRRIRNDYLREDYAHRVKELVEKHIRDLDPSVHIDNTQYFNHSAIPDFFAKWPGESGARGIYLRGSYAAILAAGETGEGAGAGIDPVFLALDSSKEFELSGRANGREDVAAAANQDSHTMLTDIEALGALSENHSRAESPLGRLVRANFVRGGKGLLDRPRVSTLAGVDATETPGLAYKLIRESFFEDAAYRMERTAHIIDLATRAQDDEAARAIWQGITGRLSRAEIREVLPWLLRDELGTNERHFWRNLGERLDFATLELEIDALRELDLSPLMEPNLGIFTAARAYAGLFPEGNESSEAAGWRVVGTTIARHVGQVAVKFTAVGTKLKATGSHSEPRWSDVVDLFGGRRLDSVSLRGITRSISINAEQSDDIRADVRRVTSSLDDSYFVTDIVARHDEPELESRTSSVYIDFRSRLAVSWSKDDASLLSLMAAIEVITYRDAIRVTSDESSFDLGEFSEVDPPEDTGFIPDDF